VAWYSGLMANLPEMRELDRVPSRRSQITETLRAAIISGEMQTGVVYSAPAIAAQLGVSPTPVREAMLHLAKEGLIDVARNKGFRIVEPSDQDLDDILELRYLIEVPTVGKLASQGVSEPDLSRLESLAKATVQAANKGNWTEHVRADLAFHQEMLELSGNRHLVETVRVLRSKSRLFGLGSPEKMHWVMSTSHEHELLVEYLRAGDRRKAESLMRNHIAHVGEAWRRSTAA
jgi:DNA-binding GntR family transcriptional regulator